MTDKNIDMYSVSKLGVTSYLGSQCVSLIDNYSEDFLTAAKKHRTSMLYQALD